MSGEATPPVRYHFHPEEEAAVETLTVIVRRMVSRPELPPRSIHSAAVLLLALQCLPYVTQGIGITLCLLQAGDYEKFWIGVTVDGERFELEKGRTVYSDAGSDNESQSGFLVTTSGRGRCNRVGNLAGWLDVFTCMGTAADVEIEFDDFGDSHPDWDDEGDPAWWSELPTSWDEEDK